MVMEEQFNCYHGEIKHKYIPGQPVLTKDYNVKEKWIQGDIIYRSGNVTYDVDIQSSVSV